MFGDADDGSTINDDNHVDHAQCVYHHRCTGCINAFIALLFVYLRLRMVNCAPPFKKKNSSILKIQNKRNVPLQ